MTAPTQGEAITLAAIMLGLDPEQIGGALIIVGLLDGSVGVASTGCDTADAVVLISGALGRLALGMRTGEQP